MLRVVGALAPSAAEGKGRGTRLRSRRGLVGGHCEAERLGLSFPWLAAPRVGAAGLCPEGISSSLRPGSGLAARAGSHGASALGEDRARPGRSGSERSQGGTEAPLPHLVYLHFLLAIVSFDLENKPDFVSGFYFK